MKKPSTDPGITSSSRFDPSFKGSSFSVRKFSTGATRDTETGKPDPEGFLCPNNIRIFNEYMTKHRVQSDGKLRDSDNWQKGFGLNVCMKSGWRHFHDWWLEHRGFESRDGVNDALCGLIFNAFAYMREYNKKK